MRWRRRWAEPRACSKERGGAERGPRAGEWSWGLKTLARTWNTESETEVQVSTDTMGQEQVTTLSNIPLLGRGRAGTDLLGSVAHVPSASSSFPPTSYIPTSSSKERDHVGNCKLYPTGSQVKHRLYWMGRGGPQEPFGGL